MSSPSTIADPVLPLEIFDKIIDMLACRDPEKSYNQTQLDGLRACALVCRHFGQQTQQRLFERLELRNPSTEEGKEKLTRLRGVFDDNAPLVERVRELAVIFHTADGRLSAHLAQEDTDKTLLPQLPNLMLLSITRNFIPRATRASLSKEIFLMYMSRNNIQTLIMDNAMDVDLWPAILESSTLKSLTIRTMVAISPANEHLTTQNRSIKHLKLENTAVLASQLRVVSLLSALEVFDAHGVKNYATFWPSQTIIPVWIPPPRIRAINITTNGAIYIGRSLVTGLKANLDRLPANQGSYLPRLCTLHVYIQSIDEVESLASLVRFIPSLERLDVKVITFFEPDRTPSLIQRLGLAITNSQILVTHLSMNFEIQNGSLDSYTALMCDILSFVGIIAQSECSLTSWSIEITMELIISRRPILESWGHLAEALADPIQFPMLRDFYARIVCWVKDCSIIGEILEDFGGEEELESSLRRKMRTLKRREDVSVDVMMRLEEVSGGRDS